MDLYNKKKKYIVFPYFSAQYPNFQCKISVLAEFWPFFCHKWTAGGRITSIFERNLNSMTTNSDQSRKNRNRLMYTRVIVITYYQRQRRRRTPTTPTPAHAQKGIFFFVFFTRFTIPGVEI